MSSKLIEGAWIAVICCGVGSTSAEMLSVQELRHEGCSAVAISKDGRVAATCGNGKVRVWECESATMIKEITSDDLKVPDVLFIPLCVALSPDGSRLSIGDEAGHLHVCSIKGDHDPVTLLAGLFYKSGIGALKHFPTQAVFDPAGDRRILCGYNAVLVEWNLNDVQMKVVNGEKLQTTKTAEVTANLRASDTYSHYYSSRLSRQGLSEIHFTEQADENRISAISGDSKGAVIGVTRPHYVQVFDVQKFKLLWQMRDASFIDINSAGSAAVVSTVEGVEVTDAKSGRRIHIVKGVRGTALNSGRERFSYVARGEFREVELSTHKSHTRATFGPEFVELSSWATSEGPIAAILKWRGIRGATLVSERHPVK